MEREFCMVDGHWQDISHKIWNNGHPEDKICYGDGNVIHHIDENPLNNDINNLQKMTKAEHNILHQTGKIHSKETKIKMSLSKKGDKNPMFGTHRYGNNSPNAKYIMAEYQIFETRNRAAEVIGVDPSLIRYRIKTNKPGYFYIQ